MNKKLLLVATTVFILSCSTLLPQKTEPATVPSTSTDTATPAASTNDKSVGFTVVRLHTQDGNLEELLAAEAAKAIAANLHPFLEFDATWCPPCQAIEASIKAKDPLTMKAFEGVYLIRADVDEWGWGDGKNFKFDAIPIYYQLDDNGKPTGASVNGGAWNEDIPENFAPVLDDFFHIQ